MKESNNEAITKNQLSELIAKISTNEDVGETINDILKYALDYYNADRAYIFDVDRLLSMGCNTYEVCANGVTPEIDNLKNVPYEIAPRWAENFLEGKSVFLRNIEDLKENYYSEYEFLKVQDITSLMAVPYNKKGVSGCVGVDNPKINCQDDYMLQNLAYLILLCFIEEQMATSIISSIKNEHIKTKNDVFVKTFGDFEINTYANNYNALNVNSKQCLLFFIYLLLNKNETITVEKLSQTFWPNQEVLEPYDYIKNMAFRTRKVLKNITDNDMVIAKNGSYAINDKLNITTDYDIVDALYDETKTSESDKLKIENYKKIIEIYDNTMFNNITTELWMVSFINKYKSIYIDTVENYLKLLTLQERYEEMLKITERAIKINYRVFNFHYYTILAYLGEKKISIAESYLDNCRDLITDSEFDELKKIINCEKFPV